jgi:hypothetical protein|tara:strand:+ start:61 stop:1098 length:1038 start_codon:yes stop_codon:yes gene_type:complete
MSNPLDRLKKAAKKGFKEIKKGIGSIANKAADKLVPKELAPFLPLLSFVPGLNLGLGSLFGLGQTASTYLIPQLLTALSTGKSQGDINLGAQAITGLGSFLSDPVNRFEFTRPATPAGSPPVPGLTVDTPIDFADIADPGFSERMKNAVNVSRDFFSGENLAFDKFKRPILDPETGLQLAVKDASFAANVPRLATSIGIGSVPGAMSYIARKTQEAEEEEAKREAEREEMLAARGALSDYFFSLSDPTNRFRDFRIFSANGGRIGMEMGGIMNAAPGMPQGMQVDGRNGTFIPMGVKEKADDVPAMLSKNEFVMTADAVKAAGGGSVEKGAQRMYDLMNTLEGKV